MVSVSWGFGQVKRNGSQTICPVVVVTATMKTVNDVQRRPKLPYPFQRPPDLVGQKFKRIFNRSLHTFWDPLTGFDAIKFDDWLKPEAGTSTRDAVLSRYGEEALNLIENLMEPG
jgi:hypothetical protein